MLQRTVTTFGAIAFAVLALTACGGGGGGAGASNGVASLDDDGNSAGGSSTDDTVADEDIEEALLDWAACMREQGVDIPDPTVDSDGRIMIGGPRPGEDDASDSSSEPPDREAMDAAREKCGDPPRPAGAFNEEDREKFQESALKFAQCMRDEGITDFPDPDFSQQGPGVVMRGRDSDSGSDDASDAGGRVTGGPFGDIDVDDPEVQAAMDACREKLGDEGLPMRGPITRQQGGEDDNG
jgi:hypothetical protein